jgi:hypothetical protein
MTAGVQLPAVVVPVYNAAPELDCCLRSLRATVPAGAEVILIDDASPDPAVGEVLRRWRAQAIPGWRYLANPENLGFVATANRGMRETAGDVVLLNAQRSRDRHRDALDQQRRDRLDSAILCRQPGAKRPVGLLDGVDRCDAGSRTTAVS